ncbi:hypothetical protein CQ12_37845 [Bradyrhizobium jicamae]|uniref:Uncharacterized protein n=1 Tax=Bradyrhizobium jicamae TaxID=280332 RepID=A0A0R3M7K6_9BRAD|nr:hypothetical protein CQ12_37845 [Bradyrhizobium jicamae]
MSFGDRRRPVRRKALRFQGQNIDDTTICRYSKGKAIVAGPAWPLLAGFVRRMNLSGANALIY